MGRKLKELLREVDGDGGLYVWIVMCVMLIPATLGGIAPAVATLVTFTLAAIAYRLLTRG